MNSSILVQFKLVVQRAPHNSSRRLIFQLLLFRRLRVTRKMSYRCLLTWYQAKKRSIPLDRTPVPSVNEREANSRMDVQRPWYLHATDGQTAQYCLQFAAISPSRRRHSNNPSPKSNPLLQLFAIFTSVFQPDCLHLSVPYFSIQELIEIYS
jgi:hypothetical protein